MRTFFAFAGLVSITAMAASAHADILHTYEDLTEDFYGTTFHHDGVTYRDVNNVSGVNPDGWTFNPGDLGTHLAVEQATYLYDDFPTFGSPENALTFGDYYVSGPNLSIGALASVYLDLDDLANAASFDIAFYENGPWGNVVYQVDALRNGGVVASDSYTLADGGGRDNVNWTTLAVSGAEFDSLHIYATLNGEYTGARGMIDDLAITSAPVPEPATLSALGLGALALLRRRRTAKK
ncbi:MAG: hypothetical protein BGO01_06055 [Armatimonadetes bacterium 55-13]|nr:PEP-CTERM sorting domain-containing protein [Armatimonadota bacterium]OJU61628.1 MAG: hypothetical protein BGO01_06055 [Armatimonadetes bacterium 55-13]